MGRLEEAVAFCRQAADIYVALGDQADEGRVRNNVADTLVKLRRYAEAREEILRAIECKRPFGHAALPWTSWAILHDIEQARGDAAAARAAWRQARDSYLAYRREGGYAQSGAGKLCEQVLQSLQRGDRPRAAQAVAQARQAGWSQAFVAALQAILDGARDPALADDPALDYDDAAEVALLAARLGA